MFYFYSIFDHLYCSLLYYYFISFITIVYWYICILYWTICVYKFYITISSFLFLLYIVAFLFYIRPFVFTEFTLLFYPFSFLLYTVNVYIQSLVQFYSMRKNHLYCAICLFTLLQAISLAKKNQSSFQP